MSNAPKRYDLVVVGASFAGLVAARTAAMRGLEVAAAALVLCFGVLLLLGYVSTERLIV